jgi:protocatechuate 3,4-dioxygenase beta subunit
VSLEVIVPIGDPGGFHSRIERTEVRGPDPIEMPDIVIPAERDKAAERSRTMPVPGAVSYQPVAPTRAVCEAVLSEIGRDAVTSDMIDRAWLFTRPQFHWHANIKEVRDALGELQMIEWIDQTARQLTGKPADSLTVFRGALDYGSGWYDEIVRENITESRADRDRAAVTVRGTVVEAETSKPVAGAIVYASDGLARTDAAGRFQLQTRAPQAKGMIWVEAEGFALCEYPALVDPGKQADVRISLGREELIGGLVVGPDGRPVAGATVMANVKHFEFRAPNAGATAGGSSFGFPIEVHTGADGRFVMRGMPRGLRLGWWEVRHPEFQTLDSTGDALSAAESMTLKLAAGCSVSGVVIDESGRSIPGADVQIRSPSSAGYQTRTRANHDGRFRFGNVSPGRWTVFVQPLRQAPVHGTIVASTNRPAENQFVVGPSSYIGGRVIGPDGSPVEGAAVGWAKPVDERSQEIDPLELSRTTRTAKDGTFRFGPVSQGVYALTGLAEQPRRIGHVTASANSVDTVIRLELEKKQ